MVVTTYTFNLFNRGFNEALISFNGTFPIPFVTSSNINCLGMGGRIKEQKNEYSYFCSKNHRDWKKKAPKDDEKWVRGRNCSMVRSLNIHATDNLVTQTVLSQYFSSDLFKVQLKKGLLEDILEEQNSDTTKKNKQKSKRLSRELNKIRETIAEFEVSKLLNTDGDDVVDEKILQNLRKQKNSTQAKIEAIEFLDNTVSAPLKVEDIDDIVTYFSELLGLIEDYEGYFVDEKTKKNFLNHVVDKINVFYHESANEHELVFDMKIPLSSKVSRKQKAKKKLKNQESIYELSYPQTKQNRHGGVVGNGGGGAFK